MNFDNKLVAIVNKQLESGVAMNALSHMALGLGATIGKETSRLDTYIDANGNQYPNISQMPFIILRGKSNEIRKTVFSARENNITHTVYLHTMTGGTYLEQLDKTKQLTEEALEYYGCTLFGSREIISEMTRKFSLWR